MGTKWDNVNARATPDPQLLEYCESDKQKEYLAAWIEFGTSAAAAKELGCNDYNVRACKKLVESNAAKKGWQKSDNHIPDGYKLKGKSTLLDSDGNAKIQWVKTEVDKERQEEMMRELCDNLKENIKPWPVVKAPKK